MWRQTHEANTTFHGKQSASIGRYMLGCADRSYHDRAHERPGTHGEGAEADRGRHGRSGCEGLKGDMRALQRVTEKKIEPCFSFFLEENVSAICFLSLSSDYDGLSEIMSSLHGIILDRFMSYLVLLRSPVCTRGQVARGTAW